MTLILIGCSPKDVVLEINGKVAIEEDRFLGTKVYHNVYQNDKKTIFDIYQKYPVEGKEWNHVTTFLFHQQSGFKFYFDEEGYLAGFTVDLSDQLTEADKQVIKKYRLDDVMNKVRWIVACYDQIEQPILSYEEGDYIVYVPIRESKQVLVTVKDDVQNDFINQRVEEFEEKYRQRLDSIEYNLQYQAEMERRQLEAKYEGERARLISTLSANVKKIYPQFKVENEVAGDKKITIVLKIDFSEIDPSYIHDIKLKYTLEYPLTAFYEDELVIENTGEIVEIRKEVDYPSVEYDAQIHTMNGYDTTTEILEINTLEVPSALVGKEDMLGEYENEYISAN